MPGEVTIFEEAECITPYSKLGQFTNPIFEYEPNYFYATQLYSRDVEVFLKNTGESILVSPFEIFVHQY